MRIGLRVDPEPVEGSTGQLVPLASTGSASYWPFLGTHPRLKADLERLDGGTVSALITSLKRRGVSEHLIEEALNEVVHP